MQVAGLQQKKTEPAEAKDVPVFPRQMALFVLGDGAVFSLGHVEQSD